MENIYLIKNYRGKFCGTEVYRSLESARDALEEMNQRTGDYNNYHIDDEQLPFVKRSVCYLSLYKGFDYDYSGGGINDLLYKSDIYSCSQHAKTHEWWTQAQEAKEKNPDDYYIDDNQICSIEYGEKFTYGDCMSGNFNLSIKRLKVRA